MAKAYKLTPTEVPVRPRGSVYTDIVADFMQQGAESMEVHLDEVKPATLRSGLRAALKNRGGQDVKLVQRGDATYLVKGRPDPEE